MGSWRAGLEIAPEQHKTSGSQPGLAAVQPDSSEDGSQKSEDPDPPQIVSFELALEILLAAAIRHAPRPPVIHEAYAVFVEVGKPKRQQNFADKWCTSGGKAGAILHPRDAAYEDAQMRCRYGTIKQAGNPRRTYSEFQLMPGGLKMAPPGADLEALSQRRIYHVRPHVKDLRSLQHNDGVPSEPGASPRGIVMQPLLSDNDAQHILIEEFRQPRTEEHRAMKARPTELGEAAACSIFIECPKLRKGQRGKATDKWKHTRSSCKKENGVVIKYGICTLVSGVRFRYYEHVYPAELIGAPDTASLFQLLPLRVIHNSSALATAPIKKEVRAPLLEGAPPPKRQRSTSAAVGATGSYQALIGLLALAGFGEHLLVDSETAL